MLNKNLKNIFFNVFVVMIIFILDRVSKIYILSLAETGDIFNIYINQFVNFHLIWNTGIGFGLLSSNTSFYYNLITFLIILVNSIILIMIFKNKKYKAFLLIMIFGGSLGNLFDRIYYKAVPDFINLHYNDFHWFIFNVADIFITVGVICLIFDEFFFNNQMINND